MTQSQCFEADVARFDAIFRAADALRTADDGFRYVDTSKVPPSVAGAYSRLLQYGYANGLV